MAENTRDTRPVSLEAATDPDEGPGERHALVVGIDEYQDPSIRNLTCAAADAKAFHELLVDPALGRCAPENARLLLNGEATRKAVVSELADELPKRVKPDDTVILYFAGHGSPVVSQARTDSGDGVDKYLVPHDAELDGLRSSGIDMADIQKYLEWINTRQILFFLDCCYSGAAEGRTVSGLATRATLSDDFIGKIAGEGTFIVTACDANEVSLESDETGHGIFTYHLLQGIAGAADRDQDGLVTINELYEYVYENVTDHARKMGGKMTPVQRGSVRGRIFLSKYVTERQKEARALALEAEAALGEERFAKGVELLARAVELDPTESGWSERLSELEARLAAEKEARAKALREKQALLYEHYNAGDLTPELFNECIEVLKRPAGERSERGQRLVRLLQDVADRQISIQTLVSAVSLIPRTAVDPALDSTPPPEPPPAPTPALEERVEPPSRPAASAPPEESPSAPEADAPPATAKPPEPEQERPEPGAPEPEAPRATPSTREESKPEPEPKAEAKPKATRTPPAATPSPPKERPSPPAAKPSPAKRKAKEKSPPTPIWAVVALVVLGGFAWWRSGTRPDGQGPPAVEAASEAAAVPVAPVEIRSFTAGGAGSGGGSATVSPGASLTLAWDVTGAESVTLTPPGREVPSSGSMAVTPWEGGTWVLAASGDGGTDRESIAVRVLVPTEIGNLVAALNSGNRARYQDAMVTLRDEHGSDPATVFATLDLLESGQVTASGRVVALQALMMTSGRAWPQELQDRARSWVTGLDTSGMGGSTLGEVRRFRNFLAGL